MTPEVALAALKSHANIENAAKMARFHKVKRKYLGIANPVLEGLSKTWRADVDLEGRVALAAGLWDSDLHEARIIAAKLFTQARIRPDDAVWDEICRWVPQLDAWAIADQVAGAGARRVVADAARLDTLQVWTTDESRWVRRCALDFTLPWAKLPYVSEAQKAERTRILGWAATYAEDQDWFIQKSIAGWLGTLSRHDPAAVIAFTEAHGEKLKPSTLNEATRNLPEG